MVSRLPGFTLDTGSSARGFAGTAGNILVNGARPTAKTDDLPTILRRIPAAKVERIDLIRGGAPGIDMQGQSVVANIVRRADAGSQVIITANNTLIEDGEWVPGGGIEYHGKSGSLHYEGSFARTFNRVERCAGLWLSPADPDGERARARCRAQPWHHAAGLYRAWRVDRAIIWAGNGTTISPCRPMMSPTASPIPAMADRVLTPPPASATANSAATGRRRWAISTWKPWCCSVWARKPTATPAPRTSGNAIFRGD